MSEAVHIKDLIKTYRNGTQALKGINLNIHSGDFFALLGANGAGKTTVIGILTDLVNKTSGHIQVYGKDLDHHLDEIKKSIGVVPQEFNFNIFEKVLDIVVTQAGYYGVPQKEAMKRAEPILKNLGLWDKRDKSARSLSGGMKRRLMIARALIHEPKFLILDEPTAGVDVELRHSMWAYLKKINEEGTTILLTTHYLEEVEQLCNRMAMIKDGVIIREGKVNELLRDMGDREYVLTLSKMPKAESIKAISIQPLSGDEVEIELGDDVTLSKVIMIFAEHDVEVLDVRPKTNRIEQFFLNALNN